MFLSKYDNCISCVFFHTTLHLTIKRNIFTIFLYFTKNIYFYPLEININRIDA